MSVFVAEELSEVLNTKVMIGRINIGLLNRIIIDDVLLDDQSGQEMLKVTRLSAKFDIMPFFKGKISISSVQLFGFTINLNKRNCIKISIKVICWNVCQYNIKPTFLCCKGI